MQGVGQHAETLSDGRHFHAFIEQGLGLGEEFIGEPVTLARRGRTEKRGRTFHAQFFAGPLHGDERDAECLGNLALRRAAVGDELAGEKAERSDVFGRMRENRKVAIEVTDLSVTLLESQFVGDGGAAGREDGKLDLRHGASMRTFRGSASPGSLRFLALVRESTVIGG